MENRKVDALLSRPGIDPEARIELLAIAATYLRNGEAMPENLRNHLAQAFEATAQADLSERAKTIGECLGIVGEAQRPRKLGPIDVIKASANDEDRLAGRLMEEHKISERTARKRIAEIKAANEMMQEIMSNNGLSNLVRKRTAE
ncbi:putative HTH transcriptional regulator [Sulfitobacter undariae]|uniref:Putative HTH transcriptional regulator n=1 Tax=Sulfitobacter undariae TaxID=1563671 RepID=A0A7W6H2R8_9RHOB|nr:hypothetical protein [Sulfitobacter undariae]MBB3996078.1 putative HTH transcriptional regulator [Sulfitobacter undariae]